MSTPILICDDSGFARRQMARSIPDGWDVEVSFAEHGQDALSQIREGKGDIVFLDLNMPVMDGLEFMKAYRPHQLENDTIVVFCTTENDITKIMLAMEAGANEYIMKPFDGEIIKTKLLLH